jgi:hypothetical protein
VWGGGSRGLRCRIESEVVAATHLVLIAIVVAVIGVIEIVGMNETVQWADGARLGKLWVTKPLWSRVLGVV